MTGIKWDLVDCWTACCCGILFIYFAVSVFTAVLKMMLDDTLGTDDYLYSFHVAAVAQGERSKEIAVRLGISLRTVGAHLTSIYTKLGVDSRASAVATAIAHGLLQQKG